jgi:hypothetical protein
MITRQNISLALDDEVSAFRQSVSYALTSKDLEPRFAFAKHFPNANAAVSEAIAVALSMLTLFTYKIDDHDHDRIRVMSLMFSVMSHQVSSFELFMSGHTVAADGLFRQVIEGVSLGFLFSVRSLGFLARFEAGQYTANGAVADLRRQAENVHVRKEALETVLEAYRFYHKYAHVSKLTMAATVNFSQNAPHIGALFDEDKLPQYAKEVRSRVSFARKMPNAVHGICRNLALR